MGVALCCGAWVFDVVGACGACVRLVGGWVRLESWDRRGWRGLDPADVGEVLAVGQGGVLGVEAQAVAEDAGVFEVPFELVGEDAVVFVDGLELLG